MPIIALTPLGLRVRGYPKGVRGLRGGYKGVVPVGTPYHPLSPLGLPFRVTL